MYWRRVAKKFVAFALLMLFAVSTTLSVTGGPPINLVPQGQFDPLTTVNTAPVILRTLDSTDNSDDRSKIETYNSQISFNDINQYKILLHPVRLSILQVLNQNIQMTASELRNELDVSWNVLRQNLDVLNKHGYIQIDMKFIENKPTRVVEALSKGIIDYKDLGIQLQKFF